MRQILAFGSSSHTKSSKRSASTSKTTKQSISSKNSSSSSSSNNNNNNNSHLITPTITTTTATNSSSSSSTTTISNAQKDGSSSNSNKNNNNNNSNTNNKKKKKVISTPLPPYELEVTDIDGTPFVECPLCVLLVDYASTPDLKSCGHRTCLDCMQRYLKTEINHSRLNINCPMCSEPLLQNVIKETLNDDKFYSKYESFMLRKVLAAEPDARWCPAPDCSYAVLAYGCASCPRLVCGREGCNTAFCYHCKQEWHPNQTCSAASIQRNKRAGLVLNVLNISDLIEESSQAGGGGGSSSSSNGDGADGTSGGGTEGQTGRRESSKTSQRNATLRPEDIRECPVCSSRIIKMNDGSCNHMTCSICDTEFCWLCMKEITDFHYFSPSGCTFWGKKPWSRKKKLLWRLGMLVGAPICIVFIAGIAVPAIVIGVPVWAARKLHTRLEKKRFGRYRKNAIITGGVLLSFVASPFISAMALAVGIPLLLCYVYGVVPISLCRSNGSCLTPNPSVEDLHGQFSGILTPKRSNQPSNDQRNEGVHATDVVSIGTAASHKLGNPSIDETSLYMSNISLETNSIGHVTHAERDDRESASNAALAGSIISQNVADDGNSTRALAGSIISKDSNGYTLIPAEVHYSGTNKEQLVIPGGKITNDMP